MYARMIWCCVLLFCLSAIGCKNYRFHNDARNQASGDEWYRRYTGTINGRPVVVNLQHYESATGGACYYPHQSKIISLVASGKIDATTFSFNEVTPSDGKQEEDYIPDSWQISITTAGAKGQWKSGDAKRIYPVDLKENYTDDAYAMDVYMHADSVRDKKSSVEVSAASHYNLLMPSAQMKPEDAAFLNVALMRLLGGDTSRTVHTMKDFIETEDQQYFLNFRKLLVDIQIDRNLHEDWEYNFERDRYVWIMYNSNGLLVVRIQGLDYTGGGLKGRTYRNSYACIDVAQKDIWQLSDMINIDIPRISPLLDEEARRSLKLPGGPLTKKLRVDTIPLTDNVYFTDLGITFCYAPGVIASEDDGEICLSLPFDKLKGMLKENFRKRMNLQ